MFVGLDLGTSAVKALLVDGGQRVLAAASIPLSVSRPPERAQTVPPDTAPTEAYAGRIARSRAAARLLLTEAPT